MCPILLTKGQRGVGFHSNKARDLISSWKTSGVKWTHVSICDGAEVFISLLHSLSWLWWALQVKKASAKMAKSLAQFNYGQKQEVSKIPTSGSCQCPEGITVSLLNVLFFNLWYEWACSKHGLEVIGGKHLSLAEQNHIGNRDRLAMWW